MLGKVGVFHINRLTSDTGSSHRPEVQYDFSRKVMSAMNWLTVIGSICAGASAAFLLLNVLLWIRFGRYLAPLLAALMACFTALLAMLESHLMLERAPPRADAILASANIIVGLLVIAMTWLIYALSHRIRRWLPLTVSVVLTIQLAIYMASSHGVISAYGTAFPSAMEWPGKLLSPIDQAGTAKSFALATIMLFSVSAGDAVAAEWRSGSIQRAALMTGAALLFIFGVAIPYPLTGVGITNVPYLDIFCFLIVIAALTHQVTVDLWSFSRSAANAGWTDPRWRPLLDNLDLIIADLDPRGITRSVNQCGLAALGRPTSSIIGHPWFGTVVPAAERTAGRRCFRLAVLTREIQEFQSHIVTGSGSERQIRWLTVPIREGNRTVTGVLAIGTDITGAKAAEKRVGRLRDEMAFMGRISLMESFPRQSPTK